MREIFPEKFDEYETLLDQKDIAWTESCLMHNGQPFLLLRLQEAKLEIRHRGSWRWQDADGNTITVTDQNGCDLFAKKIQYSYHGIVWADSKQIGIQIGDNIVYLHEDKTSISIEDPEEER